MLRQQVWKYRDSPVYIWGQNHNTHLLAPCQYCTQLEILFTKVHL